MVLEVGTHSYKISLYRNVGSRQHVSRTDARKHENVRSKNTSSRKYDLLCSINGGCCGVRVTSQLYACRNEVDIVFENDFVNMRVGMKILQTSRNLPRLTWMDEFLSTRNSKKSMGWSSSNDVSIGMPPSPKAAASSSWPSS